MKKNSLKYSTFFALLLFLMAPNFAKAATEFVSTVMQNGGEYAGVSAWNVAMTASGGVDLTSNGTKVFSHTGIIGTVPDGSVVSGSISAATGIAVHANSNQILLKNIVGVFQIGENIQVDGSDYVNILDAGDSVILTAKIDGVWSVPESNNYITLENATTSATNYLRIYTTLSARHNGRWSDSAYTFAPGSYGHFYVYDSYVEIDGLQILAPNGNSNVVFSSSPTISPSVIKISNNIFSGAGRGLGLMRIGGSGTTKIWNNLFYDWTGQGTAISLHYNSEAYLYNNTIVGMGVGIANDSNVGTGQHLINNLVSNNSVDYFGIFSSDSVNNLSSDSTSPNPAFRLKAASFVDPANRSFFLSSADTVAMNQGQNLSSNSNIAFSFDIAANTRPQGLAWDIGANEYSISNTNSLPPVIYTITASAGAGGSITPIGTATFSSGASQSYLIMSDPGYIIESLTVDGVVMQGQGAYTFSNLIANHTISATFALISTIGTSVTNPMNFHPISYAYSPLQTLYISPSGSDSNDCSQANPCREITRAMSLASVGTMISVADGVYDHFKITSVNGTAENPIVIKAEGQNAIISAANTDADGTRGNVYIHWSSYITLDGLKTYSGAGGLGAGIAFRTSPHITIRNCVTGNNNMWGIYSGYSDYSLIENNEAYGSKNQHGIYIANTTHFPIVRGNLVHDNKASNGALGLHMNGDQWTSPETDGNGVILYAGALTFTITDALIENNIFYNNGMGMDMDGGQDSIIRNNIFLNNLSKGLVLFQQDGGLPPANIKVYNNTLVMPDNSYTAFRFTVAGGPIIVRNNIVTAAKVACPNYLATDMTTADALLYFDMDYNIFVGDSSGAFGLGASNCNTSITGWQAQGKDLHSTVLSSVDAVKFLSTTNFHLQANSPAINIGVSLIGDVLFDRDGNSRPQVLLYDIGAYEFDLTAPNAPVGLSVL